MSKDEIQALDDRIFILTKILELAHQVENKEIGITEALVKLAQALGADI